jgi:YrbI family 3-deoxy-D-manno-octulosonate 8-phosphate phosphatase
MDAKFPNINSIHTLVFDFDGIFTNNKVYVREDGLEMVCCDRADGLALDMLRSVCAKKQLQLDRFILSKEKNIVVETRAKKLQLPCFSGIGNKLEFLKKYFSKHRVDDQDPFVGMIYLGNDLNDLPVIKHAGFSVVPNDAHFMVKSVASAILSQKGGHGFVRSFVEKFLDINKLTIGEVNELIFNS